MKNKLKLAMLMYIFVLQFFLSCTKDAYIEQEDTHDSFFENSIVFFNDFEIRKHNMKSVNDFIYKLENYLIENKIDYDKTKYVFYKYIYVDNKLRNNDEIISSLYKDSIITKKQMDFIKTLENKLSKATNIDEYFEIIEQGKEEVLNLNLSSKKENQQLLLTLDIIKAYSHIIVNNNEDITIISINGLMCGFAVAGWGLAFAGLVTATGGSGVVIAGVAYSLATASLAGCFAVFPPPTWLIPN